MVTLRQAKLNTGEEYTWWNLVFFVLFDRWLVLFDFPTFLILFTDKLSYRRIVPFLIFCHWLLRNAGGVMFGVIRYFMQNKFQPLEVSLNSWRYTTGLPTLFWYAGELCLDAYPFLKAQAVCGERNWLKMVCYLGFVPLVIAKIAMICFRYAYVFIAADETAYFEWANVADAYVLGLVAWSDLLNSFVIVYMGTESRRITRNDFLGNLVKTTELRIVICTILSGFAVALIASSNCSADSTVNGTCPFRGARNIAIDTAYSLYILDYLLIKYHKVSQTRKPSRAGLKQNGENENGAAGGLMKWPGALGNNNNNNGLSGVIGFRSDRDQSNKSVENLTTDMDTPSFLMLKRQAQPVAQGSGVQVESRVSFAVQNNNTRDSRQAYTGNNMENSRW